VPHLDNRSSRLIVYADLMVCAKLILQEKNLETSGSVNKVKIPPALFFAAT